MFLVTEASRLSSDRVHHVHSPLVPSREKLHRIHPEQGHLSSCSDLVWYILAPY